MERRCSQNTWAFRRFLKLTWDVATLMVVGRLFHHLGTNKENTVSALCVGVAMACGILRRNVVLEMEHKPD